MEELIRISEARIEAMDQSQSEQYAEFNRFVKEFENGIEELNNILER